jgi:hypothetical protein
MAKFYLLLSQLRATLYTDESTEIQIIYTKQNGTYSCIA